MKFRSGANQGGGGVGGGESVHRFKSAPARAAEFISNLLTPLALQIETSSSAGGGAEREGDRVIYAPRPPRSVLIGQEARTSGD